MLPVFKIRTLFLTKQTNFQQKELPAIPWPVSFASWSSSVETKNAPDYVVKVREVTWDFRLPIFYHLSLNTVRCVVRADTPLWRKATAPRPGSFNLHHSRARFWGKTHHRVT